MEWIMSMMMDAWNLIPLPDGIKLFIVMTIPGAGKGAIWVPFAIHRVYLSLEETVFFCSLGTCIKAGYYFLLVYGAEKWFIKKGFLSAQKFEKWLELARKKHKTLYECIGIFSLAVIPSVGPGILPAACLAYVCGIGVLRGSLVTVTGATIGTYILALGWAQV